MIKHIVMFRFTDIKDDNDRLEKTLQMKNIFAPLKNKIDVIKFY